MKSFSLTADQGLQVVKTSAIKEKTVPMYFKGPAVVRLALPDSRVLLFAPGVQQVPESLADHVWLKAHGAKKVEVETATPEQTAAMQPDPKLMEKYMEFFTLRGYTMQDVNQTALKLDRMAAEDKESNGARTSVAGFLQDFADNYEIEKAAKAQRDSVEQQRADSRAKLETVLAAMNKEELVNFAKQKYGVELAGSMKKPEMVQAVLNAAEEENTDATGKG